MICPECNEYTPTRRYLSACDSGEPDMIEGSKCPHCGKCVLDDEWLDEENEAEPKTSTLKLADHEALVHSRHGVKQLPLAGVNQVDCAGITMHSVSALDELMLRTPSATFINMDEYTHQQYEWVLEARRKFSD